MAASSQASSNDLKLRDVNPNSISVESVKEKFSPKSLVKVTAADPEITL